MSEDVTGTCRRIPYDAASSDRSVECCCATGHVSAGDIASRREARDTPYRHVLRIAGWLGGLATFDVCRSSNWNRKRILDLCR